MAQHLETEQLLFQLYLEKQFQVPVPQPSPNQAII